MKTPRSKTVVLTSRQNFRWMSMQEIIPMIERSWLLSAKKGQHEVICRNVDQIPISELMPELLSADNIVFACFTVKLARIGEMLRKDFALDARYFIYLHNQATIACWPYHVWGIGGYLRESDIFIASSRADAKAFRHSFKKGKVEVIPFTIPGNNKRQSVPQLDSGAVPFIYVGRLSVQKNLHALIYALKLFGDSTSKPWKLTVYGSDDNLGSPNMGMPSKKYAQSLKKLSRLLELDNQIQFKGFRSREFINRELSMRRHIIVSASLHSDENFGMAPFHSLIRGNLAVLSRWGGYADFGKQFGNKVFLVPVEKTLLGPAIDPYKLSFQLGQAAESFSLAKRGKASVPNYYQLNSISERLLKLSLRESKIGPRLQVTALGKKVVSNRALYRNDSCQIFESYSDSIAEKLFTSYGMSNKLRRKTVGKNLRCYPWVTISRRSILVRDPHRGDFDFPIQKKERQSVQLSDWAGETREVSYGTARRLLELEAAGSEAILKRRVGSHEHSG